MDNILINLDDSLMSSNLSVEKAVLIMIFQLLKKKWEMNPMSYR